MSRKTITDVAQAAGVSIKTVSRVINREPNVKPAMQARVERAIAKLGYVPNTAARSLAADRSFVLATLFDNPSPSYVTAIQRGAMGVCRQAGYHLTIEELDSKANVAAQMKRILATSRLDGVILSPPITDQDAVLSALEAKGIPYVRLSPGAFSGRSPAVVVDDAAAAGDVAAHFWRLGHRRFAVITGPENHGASKWRLDGFMAGIARCGGQARQVRVIGGDFTFPSGMAAASKAFKATKPPTAIFASNDEMAAGVYAAAAQAGLRIPDDVSVAGYDDTAVAELIWPPLTTVRQPVVDLAAAAARLLIERPPAASDMVIKMDYELVIRQSTGPAVWGY
jgi:LacI family transcriptional regulator